MIKYMHLFVFLLVSSVAFAGFDFYPTNPIPYRLDKVSFFNGSAHFVKTAHVQRGQGFFQALKSVGLENERALEIINSLRDEVEFSKLKVGDEITATFDTHQNLVSFTFSQSPAEVHMLERDVLAHGWNYSLRIAQTRWFSKVITGEISQGETLQGNLLKRGYSPRVVNDIVSALTCKVNFRMNARVGDQFKALIKERYYQDQIIETKVLYTSYSGSRAGDHETFLYEDSEKGSTYNAHYTENGEALIRSGLRYPLSRLHIRSNFGMRRHPVTGKRSMHRGVDLRGRTGTPVHAVASGKVVISTYNKFAGNKVAIRHRDGSTSYYFHLNKRRVKKGQFVNSYQVIGTVGKTGRVTGPHLHFGFKQPNGKWMNPLNKRMIATPKLKGERLEKLSEQIAQIKQQLLDLSIDQDSQYLLAKIPNLPERKKFELSKLSLSLTRTLASESE